MLTHSHGTEGEEERAAWEEYERRCEERRDRIGLVDLGEVMQEGVTAPEMLVDDLLVEAEHHYVYGQKESAKTWILLHACRQLVEADKTVLWADMEMGRKNVADRLIALGAEPEAVSAHFVYLEFPALDLGEETTVLWRTLLRVKEPALVVFDAQTEFLGVAKLNENIGTDIERWAQPYITPARRIGAATVVLDHVPHGGADRPVASRQKGAAAKVELKVIRDEPFGREKVGRVTVERTKNTVSAPIPEKQSFHIGGDGEGGFVFEPAEPAIDPNYAAKAEQEENVRQAIVEVLRGEGTEISQSNLRTLVRGKVDGGVADKRFNEIAREMASDDQHPVAVEPRGQVRFYSLDDGD